MIIMKMPVSTPTLTPETEKALKKNRDKKNVCILCGRYSVYVKKIYTADKKYYSYQYICPIIEKKSCVGKKLKITDSIPIIDDTTHSDIVYTADENDMRQKATDLEITPKYGEIFTETELKSYGYVDKASIKARKVKKALEELSVEVSKKADEAIAREKAREKALEKALKAEEEELKAEVTKKAEEAMAREKARKVKEEQNKSLVSTARKLDFDDLNSYKQNSIKKHKKLFEKYDKNGNFVRKIQDSPNKETVNEYDKIIKEFEEFEKNNPLSPVGNLFKLMDIAINSSTAAEFLNHPAIKTPVKTESNIETKSEYRETGNAKVSYTKLQLI